MEGSTILAGDVGGTKVHLALYELREGKLNEKREMQYPSRQFSGLEQIAQEFLGSQKVLAACFGVPGPVRDGRLRLTNLPWTLDSRELATGLGIDRVFLINDLEANGYGLAELSDDQIFTLSEGVPSEFGTRALIAAGTGLGEAFLTWDGRSYVPHPSEGGHVEFAPRNEDEIDLLLYLRRKYDGRVSYDRIVTGQGLTNMYDFLRDVRGMQVPAPLAERMAAEDPNAVITELAIAAESPICEKALDLFISAYGAEAGNLALKVFSAGGIYVGGGIAPRIFEKLKEGGFMKAFTDKGRLSPLLVSMPVHVVLESRAALVGAAAYAGSRAAELAST